MSKCFADRWRHLLHGKHEHYVQLKSLAVCQARTLRDAHCNRALNQLSSHASWQGFVHDTAFSVYVTPKMLRAGTLFWSEIPQGELVKSIFFVSLVTYDARAEGKINSPCHVSLFVRTALFQMIQFGNPFRFYIFMLTAVEIYLTDLSLAAAHAATLCDKHCLSQRASARCWLHMANIIIYAKVISPA